MKITGIHIDGFGVWHERSWAGLAPTLNVFHGPNEAGKTTLMSFVRSVLFGFERRSHARRYEPLSGGQHGGVLDVSYRGLPLRIERKAGRRVRGDVCLHATPEEGAGAESVEGVERVEGEDPDQALERILGGTTRTLYHNVFAFGLEELEQFRTLEDADVASHISGAGMGLGARRWSQVWKDLEDRRSRLFLPRGQNSTINRALAELEAVREVLGETVGQPDDYLAAHERRLVLEGEIQELKTEADRLSKRLAHSARLGEAEPNRRKRVEIEAEIAELDVVDSFPEGGVERLNLLLHQRRQFEAEMDVHRAETEKLRDERRQLASTYVPQELIRRTRALESLRTLLPRRSAAEEILRAAAARRDAASRDLLEMQARRDRERPPSWIATVVFMAVVAAGAAGLLLAGQDVAGGVVVASILLVGVWYYRRVQTIRRLTGECEAWNERLESAEEEVSRAEADRWQIWRSIESLSGSGEFSYVDLERETLKIQELSEMADRIRSIDETLSNEERQRERIRRKMEENRRTVDGLLSGGGAASESEFFRRAEVFRKRRDLSEALARVPAVELTPGPDTLDIVTFDPEVHQTISIEFAQVEERLGAARTELGRLQERIASLGRSEHRSRTRVKEESIRTRIDEASEKWAVLTLCRTLLDETRRVYETDRQPEVVRHASEFFSKMSDRRWRRVVAPLGDGDISVESSSGGRVAPQHLSRGTAEQLYLAMRFALIREYSRNVEPLPVIFDDIFVNFDPERTRRSLEAVRELSETHQVLMFTCHPHLLAQVEEIVPSANVYPLQ